MYVEDIRRWKKIKRFFYLTYLISQLFELFGYTKMYMRNVSGVKMAEREKLNRFEKARIIGARAFQISMGAPPLLKISVDTWDPIKIARAEFEKDVIPITIVRK